MWWFWGRGIINATVIQTGTYTSVDVGVVSYHEKSVTIVMSDFWQLIRVIGKLALAFAVYPAYYGWTGYDWPCQKRPPLYPRENMWEPPVHISFMPFHMLLLLYVPYVIEFTLRVAWNLLKSDKNKIV